MDLSAKKGQFYFERKCSLALLLVDVVVEQLDNEVDVGQNHAAAAVAFAAELIESVGSRNTLAVDQVKIPIPLVAHYLYTPQHDKLSV